MDANQLLSSAVELGLDLLEKHGDFLPFCKAINAAGESIVYSPSSESGEGFTEPEASETVRSSVLRDLRSRELVGVAFCHHTRIRFSDSSDKVPAVQVELHYRGQPAVVWYFPYKFEGTTAQVLEYYTNDLDDNLFAEAEPGASPEGGVS